MNYSEMLYKTVSKKEWDKVRELLKTLQSADEPDNLSPDHGGRNALYFALIDGEFSIASRLYELGMRLDCPLQNCTESDSGDNPAAAFMRDEASLLSVFMTAFSVTIDTDGSEDIKGALPATGIGFEAFVFVREAIDVEAEIKKLQGEIEKNEKLLEGSLKKLSNENFISHAKPEAVEKEKSKKAEFEDKIQKAKEHIELLRSF